MFKALLLTKTEVPAPQVAITELDEAQLPAGDVLVQVSHSTLNYKDALAITGKAPVVRSWPMVPGIDFAGAVLESSDPRYRPGDAVLLNGWGVGESHWGGLAQKVRVKADWLLPLPAGLTAAQAMAIGTAGYTAMLCVMALQRNGLPPAPEHLKALGATDIIDRSTLNTPGKPLQKERWAGAVDSVGSHTLANVCAGIRYGGVVAACGLAQGMDFPSTVAPFILRGVTLAGVDSVMAPHARRAEAWQRLARELPAELLPRNTETIALADAAGVAARLLAGQVRGRVVVDVMA